MIGKEELLRVKQSYNFQIFRKHIFKNNYSQAIQTTNIKRNISNTEPKSKLGYLKGIAFF